MGISGYRRKRKLGSVQSVNPHILIRKKVKEKQCTKCEKFKLVSEFSKDSKTKDKLYYQCKECTNKRHKEWYAINKEHKKSYNAKWRKDNKELQKAYGKKSYIKNKEYRDKYIKNWREENKERCIENQKKWKDVNPRYHIEYNKKWFSLSQNRLNATIGRAIGTVIKDKEQGKHWELLLGYTVGDLMKHLESKFQKDMSWDNYGRNGWHIDHIIPKSLWKFSNSNDREFKQCWSLANLQPLWAHDNLSKGNRIK